MALTIRREQMRAFERAALEAWLRRHLDLHFPGARSRALARSGRELSGYAIERGEALGLREDRHIAALANAMALLGAEFEFDPKYTWAADILAAHGPAAERLERLDGAVRERMFERPEGAT